MNSNRSRVAVLTVFAGEVEEVDFVRRVGRVGTGIVDVVRDGNEHVLF
jgi:hypothetical protein